LRGRLGARRQRAHHANENKESVSVHGKSKDHTMQRLWSIYEILAGVQGGAGHLKSDTGMDCICFLPLRIRKPAERQTRDTTGQPRQ
jgi:hypothetical protein